MSKGTIETAAEYGALLPSVVQISHTSGNRARELFSPEARVVDRDSLIEAYNRVEAAAADGLRDALSSLRPDAHWLDDDPESHRSVQERGGHWWIVDGVEGAVNFIHGGDEFSVNVTLIRNNLPVLCVVYQPIADRTYTAVLGDGSQLNGRPLAVSRKTDLKLAIATTSQAGGTSDLNRRTAQSIQTMFDHALAVRQTVPSTFPMLAVAAGHYDLYWRYGPDLPSVAPGALLAAEAGASVTDLQGNPWTANATDVIVAPPALHAEARNLLVRPRSTDRAVGGWSVSWR